MSASAPRVPSFDDLYAEICALPEGKTGMILEPGRLTVMSRPHSRHQRAMSVIRHALVSRDADLGGAGWWLLSEVEVRLDDRLLVPDMLGYRVDRVADLPDENPLRIVPDWCCEILSPSSACDDRLKKLRIYASYGVRWTWIVDPEARTIECYESVDRLPRQTVVAEAGETATLPPFDLPLEIDKLWGAGPQAAPSQK
jgi:Uma2 family endonuclease